MDLFFLLLLALFCIIIIPGLPAYFISRLVRKQSERKGSRHSRIIGNTTFLVLFGLIAIAEFVFLYYNFRLER